MAIILFVPNPSFPLVWLVAVGRVELVIADVLDALCVVERIREDVDEYTDASEVDNEGSMDADEVEDDVGGADEKEGVDAASCSGT